MDHRAIIAARFVALAVVNSANAVAAAGGKAWRAAQRLEARLERRVDRFIDTGWRRAFGWMGLAVAYFSFIYAPTNGIAVDYAAVNTFLAFATGMYVTRGLEKHLRDRLGLPPSPDSPTGPGAAAGF